MTLTPDQVAGFAQRLIKAVETRTPIENFQASFPEAQIEDAYEVSRTVVNDRVSRDPIVGYKIGLTSQAAQASAGVNEPDYGFLTQSMVSVGDHQFTEIPLFAPAVEPELAFILGSDLPTTEIEAADVIKATEGIRMAFEVIDFRYTGKVSLLDSIADNASAFGVVLATETHPLSEVLAYSGPMTVDSSGATLATGFFEDVMGDPVLAVTWLANKLSSFGVHMKAGDIILSGSITRFVPFESESTITADFGPFGRLQISR